MPFIDVLVKEQERSYWCYAAVIQAIVLYYTGHRISQESISQTFPCSDDEKHACSGHQDPAEYLVPLGLIHVKSAEQYGHGGIPPWNTVVKEIQHARPIIVYVGHHYVLLVGYEGRSARDSQRTYIFLDPLFPKPRAVSYAVLKNGYPMFDDNDERVHGYYLTQPKNDYLS